ncbi:MAG: hypothetical protein Q8P13_01840 [bacterium]|nr:hypothetical protein [bacterium]
MADRFSFFSNPRSKSIVLVADEQTINQLTLQLAAVVIGTAEAQYFAGSGKTTANSFDKIIQLYPLVEFILGVVETRVLNPSTIVLRDSWDRITVAEALKVFQAWKERTLEENEKESPGWRTDRAPQVPTYQVFLRDWTCLNEHLLAQDQQTAVSS